MRAFIVRTVAVRAISSNGSTIAIGAPLDDGDASSTVENPNANASLAGAVHIFATTDRLQWSHQAYLKAPSAGPEDAFGLALALSADGNGLAIGAIGEDGDATSSLDGDNDNQESAGAVYVYTRSESAWSMTPAGCSASPAQSMAARSPLAVNGGTMRPPINGDQQQDNIDRHKQRCARAAVHRRVTSGRPMISYRIARPIRPRQLLATLAVTMRARGRLPGLRDPGRRAGRRSSL